MITSGVLFGIAIALSGSIAISSFDFGNATNSIKGNQFVEVALGEFCTKCIFTYFEFIWLAQPIFHFTVNFGTKWIVYTS